MSRILELAGKRWLAGMSWRIFDRPPTAGLIRSEARALNANFVVQRSGSIRAPMGVEPRYDVAFAEIAAKDVKSTIFSLGAALSSSRPGPWRGEFDLGDGLSYYVAVTSDGAIIPDQFGEIVGTAEEISAAREAHKESFESATELTGDIEALGRLLAELAGPFLKLKPLKQPLNLAVIVPILAVILLAFAGYEYYSWHEAKLELQRQQELARQLALKKHPPVAISPLEQKLPPGRWLVACNPENWHVDAVENAWQIKQYQCTEVSVILTWERGPGALASPRPAGTLDDTGKMVTQLISLGTGSNGAAAHPQHTPMRSISITDARTNLMAWADRLGLTVKLAAISPVPGVPSLKQRPITIESSLRPWLLPGIDTNQTLRLSTMTSSASGVWELKGILYGN